MKVTAKKCCLNRCGTPLITCLHAKLFTVVPLRESQKIACNRVKHNVQQNSAEFYYRACGAVQERDTVVGELVSVKVTWAARC